MLKNLTPEQQARIPEFVNRWTNIGLSSEQVSDDERLKVAREVTTILLGYKENVPIILMDSPKGCWDVVEKFNKKFTQKHLLDHVGIDTYTRMSRTLEADQVWKLIENFLGGSIRDQMHKTERELRNQVDGIKRRAISNAVGEPHILGHWMAPRLAWYAFMPEVLGIWEYPGLWSTFMEIQKIGYLYPCVDFIVVGNKPVELHRNERGLHKDGGPAIKWKDGKGSYFLNGVRVPRWLAESPAMEIDCKHFSRIANVEVRREFVRKVGIERLATQLGARTVDKQGDYEVVMIDLGGRIGEWPYLKMLNPSVGVWHLECLDSRCTTVQEAINFRASRLRSLRGDWKPEKLT